MSATPTPTTELEAVNAMLSTIGEAPVNSLGDEAAHVDVARARRLLNSTSKLVQSEGWDFNTEENYTFTPDENREIRVPSNVLTIDCDTTTDPDVTQRGKKLYDKKNHRYTFNNSLNCTVIWMLPFDELPEAARQYIFIKAARMFQDSSVGSEAIHRFNQQDEAIARACLEQHEARTGDYNILNGLDEQYITRRNTPRRVYS